MDERWLHNKIRPSSSSLRLSALHIHFFWWHQMLSAGSNKERTKQGKGSELFPCPLLCLIMGEELPPTQSSLVLLSPNGEALLGRRRYFWELCVFLMWLFSSLLLCRRHKVLLFLSSSLFIWAFIPPLLLLACTSDCDHLKHTHELVYHVSFGAHMQTHIHKWGIDLAKETSREYRAHPVFFCISWLLLSFPQTLSRLHDRLIGGIAVKMEYWCSARPPAHSWFEP